MTDRTDSKQRPPTAAATLAATLGLRPLDRLQLVSSRAIAETTLLPAGLRLPDLPFYYFQRVVGEMLEVRSPGGCPGFVLPQEVCDVIPGEPMLVRAMPPRVFLERQKLPLAQRQSRPGPECYAPAYVLYTLKERWGHVNAAVWFVDPALNGEHPIYAPLTDDDRTRVERGARRTLMPVMSRTSANWSADHGVERAGAKVGRTVRQFIEAGIAGRTAEVSALACAGLGRPSRAV